jgi:hypothetical protein
MSEDGSQKLEENKVKQESEVRGLISDFGLLVSRRLLT